MKCYVECHGGFVRYDVRERGIGEGWELFLSEHRGDDDSNVPYELTENAYGIDSWPSEHRGTHS
jgi:hypothetical protein